MIADFMGLVVIPEFVPEAVRLVCASHARAHKSRTRGQKERRRRMSAAEYILGVRRRTDPTRLKSDRRQCPQPREIRLDRRIVERIAVYEMDKPEALDLWELPLEEAIAEVDALHPHCKGRNHECGLDEIEPELARFDLYHDWLVPRRTARQK